MDNLRKAAEMALGALLKYPMTEGRAIQTLRQALEQPEQEVSYTDIQMAELIMSDCGHSSDYKPLLDRIAGRLAKYRQALEQPYKGIADRMYRETNGRMRIDPVTGDVGVGSPSEQPEQPQFFYGQDPNLLTTHGKGSVNE